MTLKKISVLNAFLFLMSCSGPSPQEKKDLDTISFHRGYSFWQDYLEFAKMPYNLEKVIEGIRAADRGEKLPIDEKELAVLVRRYQEDFFARKTEQNLKEAEEFLRKIAAESIEIVPHRLYYKINRNGTGSTISSSDVPLVTYSAKTVVSGEEADIFSTGDEPVFISLPDAIPGFSQGVIGMVEGEKRTLYIHPALAHDAYTHIPNKLLIVEVELVSAEN